MHTLSGLIDSEGAILDILVGLSARDVLVLRPSGKPVPAPQAVRAMIDPGAEVTCLDPSALAAPVAGGIPPTRFLFANLPATGGLNLAAEYAVSLTFTLPAIPGRTSSCARTLSSNNPSVPWGTRR